MNEINYWKLDKEGQKVYQKVDKFNKLFPDKNIYLKRDDYDMILQGIAQHRLRECRHFIKFKNVRIERV